MINAIKGLIWQGTSVALGLLLIGSVLKSCSLERDLLKEQVTVSRLSKDMSDAQAIATKRLSDAEEEARLSEQRIRESFDQIRKAKDEEIHVISSSRDSLVSRVRDAEARAKAIASGLYGLPSTPNDSSSPSLGERDSGTILLGSLGEADVDEAYRADIIRKELNGCYAAYETMALELKSYGERLSISKESSSSR